MKHILIGGLFSFILFNTWSQNNVERIEVLVSSRVDTTLNEVKKVIQLYENYLNSRPDSIYNNPFWNTQEKNTYHDFDFSRASMFQGGILPEQLFSIFVPFVMSVEPVEDRYQIRVLFSSSTLDPRHAGSKIWCIQKLNAVLEHGEWVLENLIVELSSKWVSKRCGVIEYLFSPTHKFDSKQAKNAKRFCKEIINRFNPSYEGSIKYIVTNNIDEMGLLENFDYYFTGVTTGKTRENMILTAKGNENYPHEFVHKLLPANINRSYIIEEGLAEFLGTKLKGKEYSNLMLKLKEDLKINKDKINFQSVISQSVRYNGYQTAYPAGAAICELVYNKTDNEGLIQLIKANTSSYDEIILALKKITGLTLSELKKEWEEIVLSY